jgi:hypothetical protein
VPECCCWCLRHPLYLSTHSPTLLLVLLHTLGWLVNSNSRPASTVAKRVADNEAETTPNLTSPPTNPQQIDQLLNLALARLLLLLLLLPQPPSPAAVFLLLL